MLMALEMNAHNTFEHPDAVQPVEFKGATLDEGIVHIKLPAKSVVVLTLS
jgi:alpha-N-arabinofuranosidase